METAWTSTFKRKSYPKLTQDLVVDVAIVGGGLVGIQTAYLLAKAGKKVVVLEKKALGSDATQHTTAFITCDIDTDVTEMTTIYGKKNAKLVWQSGQNAIDAIEKNISIEGFDCEFKRTSLYIYSNEEKENKDLEDETKESQGLGFPTKMGRRLSGFKNFGAMELPNQAKFHPLKYLYGMAEAAEKNGALIFENTEVLEVTNKKAYISVTTKTQKVRATDIIIATYDPLGNPKKTLFKKGMYISYVYELEIPKGTIKEGLYLDLQNPYHYFRIDAGPKADRMIYGGADHRQEIKMSPQKNYNALLKYLKELLGPINFTVVRKWLGPILEPSDGLALIGEFKPHRYVAAAFSGNGMTYSAIAAQLFHDGIMGKKNPYKELYDPTRIPTAKQIAFKVKDYGEEFFKGAVKNIVKY